MRKTFPLDNQPHKPARVLDAIKSEVRKYLKRERRKVLPEGADFWDFDCQVGMDGPARTVEVSKLVDAIDDASNEGWATVYVEVLAKPGQRKHSDPRPGADASTDASEDGAPDDAS